MGNSLASRGADKYLNYLKLRHDPQLPLRTDSSELGDWSPGRSKTLQDDEAQRLCGFWCTAAQNFRGLNRSDNTAAYSTHFLVSCDTSEQRVQKMYRHWARDHEKLPVADVHVQLLAKHGIELTAEQLEEAIRTVDPSWDAQTTTVSIEVFTRLWQRLMLGVVCQKAYQSMRLGQQSGLDQTVVQFIKYTSGTRVRKKRKNSSKYTSGTKGREMTEYRFLFGTDWLEDDQTIHWVRIDQGNLDVWIHVAVKAYLNPIATNDAMNTAMDVMTKIRRCRDQYIMSLEVYRYEEIDDVKDHPCVVSHVRRSTMLVVATGKPSEGRDRLVTLVMDVEGNPDDPLDSFQTDRKAATEVLDKVEEQLHSDYGLHEQDADYLLFAILHSTVDEMFPIVRAYSHRLMVLRARLDTEKAFLPGEVLDEVSRMSFEFEELGQWIEQMRGIVGHLSDDATDEAHSKISFGARDADENNRNLRIHLQGTRDNLQQLDQRLTVLTKMAGAFQQDHERHRDNRMNQTLYYLTICTFVFMPFQIVAGIYGMNFVDEDGNPGIPELTWSHGYLFFWITCTLLACGVLCFAHFVCNAFR